MIFMGKEEEEMFRYLMYNWYKDKTLVLWSRLHIVRSYSVEPQ